MTNTYAPELTQQKILNSIYYWTSLGTWAPGIAFPAGPNPPLDSSVHDRDFFFRTTNSHLYQYQGGDYPNGNWFDLQEAANAILSCGTTLPGSGNEGDLFNKYDTGTIYQRINGAWRPIGSNKWGLPLGADAINFTDNYKTWRSVNLGLLLVPDTGYSPLLATDQGFVVKKDIATGGFISTNQGEIWIGHGRASSTDKPKIIMMHSGNGYGTLYLRMADATTAANLNLGKLEVQSTNNVFAVTAGDSGANQDTYLIPQNPSQGGLGLGTAAYPFKWVDATSVFTNGINSLSGGAISVYVSLNPYLTGSRDLGSDSYRWNYGWIQYLRSAELRPYANGTGYVGTSSYKYGTGYINKIYGTVGDPEPLPEPLQGIEDLKMVKFRDDGLPLETSLPEGVRLSAAVVRRQLEAERLEKPSEEEVEAVVEANVDTVNLCHVIGWLMQCCSELTQRLETLEEQLKKT